MYQEMGGLSKTLRKIATAAQAVSAGAATYARSAEQIKATVSGKTPYPYPDQYPVLDEFTVTGQRPVNWWLIGGVAAIGAVLILRGR